MANEEEMESPPPERKSKLMPLFLVINFTVMIGILALQLMKSGGDDAPEAAPPVPQEAPPPAQTAGGEPIDPKTGLPMRGPTIGLGEYVVHLRNPDMDRYARFEFRPNWDVILTSSTLRSCSSKSETALLLTSTTVPWRNSPALLALRK